MQYLNVVFQKTPNRQLDLNLRITVNEDKKLNSLKFWKLKSLVTFILIEHFLYNQM